jgi:hypothetical protein
MKISLAIVSLLLAFFCCFTAASPVLAADMTIRLLQETAEGLDIEITIPNYSLTASPYQAYKKVVIPGCGLTNNS